VNRREFFRTSALAGATLSVHSGLDQHAIAEPARPSPKPETLTPEYFGQAELAAESRLLKAGFAERDIAPARGMQMDGNYLPDFVKGFHDKCKVRAAVFDDGTQRVALVGVDSIVMHRDMVEAARKTIEERCRIPGGAVMIGATHDHSAGPVGMLEMKEFEHAAEFVQHLARDKSQVDDPSYAKWVVAQIVDAVCEADDARTEAYCGAGIGMEDKVAFTRRFHMKNGLTYTHPGQGNPDIVESSGPIDPQVGVVGAWDKGGRFLGCIVNYTCHATTNPGSGSDASANWIYYMERVIRGAMGADVPVVFLQGAAGNVTQVDNLSPYKYPQNTQWAEFVGGRVGAEAVKVLLTMVPGSLAPLSAQSVMLEIKRRVPSAEHVREAYKIVQQKTDAAGPASAADQTKWIFAKETVLLEFMVKQNPVVPVEIQTIQVGPVVFVSNPAELFCRAGLDIKTGSHFQQTAVVSYANGAVGYVPDAEALGPHGGGYETRLTSYTNLEVSAGAQIVKASIDLISRIHPGTPPSPQKAAPFGGESTEFGAHLWSFGDLPAQLD
jgi:neutral ceramidase